MSFACVFDGDTITSGAVVKSGSIEFICIDLTGFRENGCYDDANDGLLSPSCISDSDCAGVGVEVQR